MLVETRSNSELYALVKFANNFADRQLASITAEDINKALGFCKTAATYTRYCNMIAAILSLSGIKLSMIKRRDKKTKPREWITHEQWARLYVELPDHMKPMAEFAIHTGLRQANVLGLEWSRVDLARKVVWIEGEDTKADKPIRVPLNTAALAVLEAQSKLSAYRPWKSKLMLADNALAPRSAFVFLFRGKPIKDVKTSFMQACIRAGIGERDKTGYTGFTWHGLRHTWATWHVQNGTPIEVLKDLGGWSDLRMVLNYAHHAPSHIDSFANNNQPKKAIDHVHSPG